MNKYGFYIKKICVVGNDTEPASIKFDKGLNVLTGPSDTGKTYVFEILNYMLGSSDKPKSIEEAKNYNAILMEIELYSGETYTIKRKLRGNVIEAYSIEMELIEGQDPYILKTKHDKESKDNISVFYLEKSGFEPPIYILRTKKGEVRTLSFRDLKLHFTIGEEKIVKKTSPILSEQFTTKTVEKSVFEYIVSGVPYEKIKEINTGTGSPTKLEGQQELLENLMKKEERKLTLMTMEDQLSETNFEDIITSIQEELKQISDDLALKTQERRLLWAKIEEKKSKNIADNELIKRFKLLKSYYDNDLERLNFLIEGNHYFSQLNFSSCPYCNQQLDKISARHDCTINNEFVDLVPSIEAEAQKIKGKLKDLEQTLKQAEIDSLNLYREIENDMSIYSNLEEQILSILQPKKSELTKKLNTYLIEKESYIIRKTVVEKIEELKNEKQYVVNLLNSKSNNKPIMSKDDFIEIEAAIKKFCDYFSNTLKRWKLYKEPKVSYEEGQFLINMKPFEEYGKGMRAIIYSGFSISLMQYCKDFRLPHPGLIVLDSPLTTYKSKKSEEDVNQSIQTAFFNDLASLNKDMQVIILDNKEPSDELKKSINFIEFTKDKNNGRYGFFKFN